MSKDELKKLRFMGVDVQILNKLLKNPVRARKSYRRSGNNAFHNKLIELEVSLARTIIRRVRRIGKEI